MIRKTAPWALAAALAASAVPVAAQQTGRDPNVATETQERRSDGRTNEFDWNWLGLLGLAGLLGLRRAKRADGNR